MKDSTKGLVYIGEADGRPRAGWVCREDEPDYTKDLEAWKDAIDEIARVPGVEIKAVWIGTRSDLVEFLVH